MGFDNFEGNTPEGIDIVTGQTVDSATVNTDDLPQLQQGDAPFVTDAEWKAFDDAREIQALHNQGRYIVIDDTLKMARIEQYLNKCLRESKSNARPPEPDEYQRVLAVYRAAYEKRFNGQLKGIEGISYLFNQDEVRLRQVAIRDKKEEPSRHLRDYHIRDLAVVRVMQVLNISLDTAPSRLSDIHELADKYQRYYSGGGEEVVWPNQRAYFQ